MVFAIHVFQKQHELARSGRAWRLGNAPILPIPDPNVTVVFDCGRGGFVVLFVVGLDPLLLF